MKQEILDSLRYAGKKGRSWRGLCKVLVIYACEADKIEKLQDTLNELIKEGKITANTEGRWTIYKIIETPAE